MKFTENIVVLVLLNSIFSTSVKSECQRTSECCEHLNILENHFVIKKQAFEGNSQLSIKCSKNIETNDFYSQKSCNLSSKIFHEFLTETCSSEELLMFSNEYPKTSHHVKVLEFNLYYKKDKNIRLTKKLLSAFPNLQKINLLHANLELGSDDIDWPKQLTELSVHNSLQTSIPYIIGSNFKKLMIDGWPNMKNISPLNVFHELEELTLKNNDQLTSLPAKIFMKNHKLNKLKIYDNKNLIKLHSNTLFGLNDLTSITLSKNPISSIPPGFFTKAPALNSILWLDDKCRGISHRTIPSDILEGVHRLTKFHYSQHHNHACNQSLIIEKSAFHQAYETMEEFIIAKTDLGSNELIHQVAKNFRNLTKLILQDNKIQDLHPDDIPKSVSVLKIAHNPFMCKCSTLSVLSALMKNMTESDIKFIKFSDCPNSDKTVVFSDLAQTDLDCSSPSMLPIFIVVIVAIIIVIVIVCVSQSLRVWLYNNKVFSIFYPEESGNNNRFEVETTI